MNIRSIVGNQSQRRFARGLLERLAARGSTDRDPDDLRRSAIVFSPHFDDETLGCGGTILRKRALGAPVGIVFMTDGRKSHEGWIDAEELTRLREAEGVAAAEALGVVATDVHTLGFEETRLSNHADAARERVVQLIHDLSPEEVYVPHALEPPADHAATNRIVYDALREVARPVSVYEYPIWVWDYWPWTAQKKERGRRLGHVVRDLSRMNALLVRDFKHRVFIGDVLRQKRAALGMHATQMTRMNDDATWPVLSDVADGEFLECFFQEYEIFARRTPQQRAQAPATSS